MFSQIAYLENLLKVYNDEIYRLQHAELNLDDLGAEDSLYIQEHKLKRKVSLQLDQAQGSTDYRHRQVTPLLLSSSSSR